MVPNNLVLPTSENINSVENHKKQMTKRLLFNNSELINKMVFIFFFFSTIFYAGGWELIKKNVECMRPCCNMSRKRPKKKGSSILCG